MEIDKTKREDLKRYFKKYLIPKESEFAEVFDAMINQADDSIYKDTDQPLAIRSEGDSQELISFWSDFDNEIAEWTISQNTNNAGFNLSESLGGTRLFIESSTGNIGLSTSSPVKKLHIENGELKVIASHDDNTIADLATWITYDGTQGIGIGGDRIEAIGSDTDHDLNIVPAGTGSIGIGYKSPSAKLHVDGDILMQDSLFIQDSDDNDLVKIYAEQNEDTYNVVLDVYGGNEIKNRIATNGISYFNGGDMGIGVESPDTTLHVKDGEMVLYSESSGTFGYALERTSNNPYAWRFEMDSNDNLQIVNDVTQSTLFYEKGGKIGFGTTNPNGYKLNINGSVNITGTLRISGTTITSSVAEINTLDGYTGNHNALNYVKNLRGTGVTDTEYNILDGLTASTNDLNKLNLLNVTTGTFSSNKAVVVDANKKINKMWGGNVKINYSTNTIQATNSSGLYLHEVSDDGIYIKDGGMVGVGVTPTAPLHVAANASDAPTTCGIYICNTNEADKYAIACARVAGTSAGDPFISFDIAGVQGWSLGVDNSHGDRFKLGKNWNSISDNTLLTIDTNGRLGIGKNDPVIPFNLIGLSKGGVYHVGITQNHVGDDASMEITTYSSSGAATRLMMGGGTDDIDVGFYTGGRDAETLTGILKGSTAQLGIGTVEPSYKLHLVSASSNRLTVQAEDGSMTGFRTINSNMDFFTGIYNNTGNWGVHDFTNNASRLYVTSGGDMGIGTTSPDYKLHVNGTLRANKYVVQNGVNGGSSRGILMWEESNTGWAIYMGESGSGRSIAGNTAVAGDGFSSHAIRFRVADNSAKGFVFENSNEELIFSIKGDDGYAYLKGRAIIDGGLRFDGNRTSMINVDGAMYRYNGQCYITVDDNLYIRRYNEDPGIHFHFQTNEAKAYCSSGQGFSSISDIRLKKDIRPFEDGMAQLREVNPVHFKYTGQAGMIKDQEQIGIIAQEMQKAMPYTIYETKKKIEETDTEETDILAYDDTALAYVMVNALKELNAEAEALEREIKDREKRK